MTISFTIFQQECNRCWHKWMPRSEKTPKRCPACNSPYWNKPRQR